MVANEVRAEAIRRNLSMGELADRIGISRETLWRRLRNPGSFKISEIRAIQEALCLDAERVQSLFFSESFLKETKGA